MQTQALVRSDPSSNQSQEPDKQPTPNITCTRALHLSAPCANVCRPTMAPALAWSY